MMRSLMVLGALGMVGFMAGWFTINRDSGRTTIEINRDEIRSDAQQAVERGKEYWEQRRQQQAAAQQNANAQPTPWDNQAGPYPAASTPGPYGYGQPQYPQGNENGYGQDYGYGYGYEAPAYNQPANYTQPPSPGSGPWNPAPPANWQAIPAGYQNGSSTQSPQPAAPPWPQTSSAGQPY